MIKSPEKHEFPVCSLQCQKVEESTLTRHIPFAISCKLKIIFASYNYHTHVSLIKQIILSYVQWFCQFPHSLLFTRSFGMSAIGCYV